MIDKAFGFIDGKNARDPFRNIDLVRAAAAGARTLLQNIAAIVLGFSSFDLELNFLRHLVNTRE